MNFNKLKNILALKEIFLGRHCKHPGSRVIVGSQHRHKLNFDRNHPGYSKKFGKHHFHFEEIVRLYLY